jgi:hypothetical protein
MRMAGETGVYLYLAGAVAVGFLWGKVSSRIPMPELLRLLGTFVCTGILGVLFGSAFGLVRLIERTPRLEEWLSLPVLVLVQQAFFYACGCFLVGAVLGGPSILGFAFGYRKPRAE